MKKRYCETRLHQLKPCDTGWANWNENESEQCFDEPLEENCRNIIDTRYMSCPYCGSDIGEDKE